MNLTSLGPVSRLGPAIKKVALGASPLFGEKMDFRGIPPMSMSGNLAENWRFWRQRFQTYLVATEVAKKDEATQCAQLLTLIGDEGMRIFNTFDFEDTEKDKIKPLFEKFETHFNPRKNLTFERHIFLTCKQNDYHSVEQYITVLKNLSLSCELGNLRESLIKDVMICGIKSESLREKLLQADCERLEDAIKICVTSQSVKEKNKLISNGSSSSENQVDFVKRKKFNKKPQNSNWNNKPTLSSSQFSSHNHNANRVSCQKCSYKHERGKCPAFGKVCGACSMPNHFMSCCKNKKQNNSRKVHLIDESDSDNSNFVFLDSIHGIDGRGSSCGGSWTVELLVENHPVQIKLDTGAMANVMPERLLEGMDFDFSRVRTTKVKLNSYTNNSLDVLGECLLSCQHKGDVKNVLFFVVKTNSCPILGLDACLKFNLIRRICDINISDSISSLLEENSFLFKGIGCLEKPYRIELKKDAVPVVHATRTVPFAIREDLKKALNGLESEGIIEKATDGADWVHPLVIVRKRSGQLRLCVDPKDLNVHIKRHYLKLPTFESLTEEFADAKIFSTLDCTQGFLQVPLDKYSSKICTFSTIFGRYRFLRLPYGLASAPEVFQERMQEIFDDIKGVKVFIDDIIIASKDEIDHIAKLKLVFERAKKFNLKFNKDKCKFGLNEVTYMGVKITANGLKPDDSKVDALKNMPRPQDVTGVQRFLGVLTYLGRFIPNLSEKTAPLRELIKKDRIFEWGESQEKAYVKLKNILCQKPCLKFFDINKPVTISVDSSKGGMGAVLLQEGFPCAHASRALTETQTRYSQIEKELLGVWFGVTHYSQFVLFSKRFTVETDHKPLISIIKKSINSCPPRLQRMLIQLRKYDFELIYKPGKKLILADTLSRAYENKIFDENIDFELEAQVCLIELNLNTTKEKRDQILNETKSDTVLQTLKSQIHKGWPNKMSKVPNNIKFYYKFKHEITELNGLLFRDTRLIVPQSFRKEVLSKLHSNSHQGITKTLQRANLSFYWPGMNKQITDMILACNTCLIYSKSSQPEPMIPHRIEKMPWAKIAADIYHLFGQSYLIVVDYYSKFFEVINLRKNLTAENVINCLKSMFSRQGIPKQIMTDNGPEFANYKFKEFSSNWEFDHLVSSPRYPQSNGQVERFVQTIKNTLKKAMSEDKDPFLALLNLRNTPVDGKHSPAIVLYNRELRDLLPSINKKFTHNNFDRHKYNKFLDASQANQKHYFDRKAKPLSSLEKNCRVKVQLKKGDTWTDARIVKCVGIRSYKIKLENGSVLIRNRKFIKDCSLLDNRNSEIENEIPRETHKDSNSTKNCTKFVNYAQNHQFLKVCGNNTPEEFNVFSSENERESLLDDDNGNIAEKSKIVNSTNNNSDKMTDSGSSSFQNATKIVQFEKDNYSAPVEDTAVESEVSTPSSISSKLEVLPSTSAGALQTSRSGRLIHKPSRYSDFIRFNDIDSIIVERDCYNNTYC